MENSDAVIRRLADMARRVWRALVPDSFADRPFGRGAGFSSGRADMVPIARLGYALVDTLVPMTLLSHSFPWFANKMCYAGV